MSAGNVSIRDALYEAPGPRAKRWIRAVTAVSIIALLALIGLIIRQFYITGQLDAKYWEFFGRWTTWRFIGEGLLMTMQVALMAAVITFVIGFVLMRGRLCRWKPVSFTATALIEFTRGVPTLLFIYFFFLAAPQFGLRLSSYWRITLPCAISACGVVAEVFRSGVQAVPKGQREAAVSLGMTERRAFYRVIFPQAFRYVVPALIAELVIVLKDTTFAYVVTCADLMQNAKVLISNYDALVSVYLVVAVIYILINYLLNKLSGKLAKRMNKYGGA